MIQAFYMGTSRSMDAFTIAYVIPNLLRRLTGEGAMTAAFIPVFTQIKKEKTKAELWRFANIFFYDLTLIMAFITVTGIIISPFLVRIIGFGFKNIAGKWELTTALTRLMFPYIFLISLAALAMAILNSFHKFFVPALTPVLFNLAIITAAVFLAGRVAEPAYVFAGGVVLGGVLQLGLQLPFLWKKGMRFTPLLSFRHPAVRKVGKLMIPGIFGVGISQINFALSRMIASLLEEGSVSSLYFASRVQEFTLGIFSIALSIALLPTLSEYAAEKDIDSIKSTLQFSFKLILLVTIPAAIGLLTLNREIIEVLFQRGLFNTQSTAMSAQCLFYFSLSLPFLSGVKILAPAFYSLKDTKTPVIVAFWVMICYLLLAIVLMRPLKVGGIALALSLASAFNFFLLFHLLERKIGVISKKKILISGGKCLLSALFMGAGVLYFMHLVHFTEASSWAKVGLLSGAIIVGVILYSLLQWMSNKEDFKGVLSLFVRRFQPREKGKR
jgi:putative peptidoglycan lipid II flippase